MAGRLLLVGYWVLLAALLSAVLVVLSILLGPGWVVLGAMILLGWMFARYVLAGRGKPEPPTAWASRNRHPDLWAVVDELAAAADTRSPDEIRFVPEVSVRVVEEASVFGSAPGFRKLMIGLPLLAGLTVSELRAVVGHELGHFSHDQAKFSVLEYRAKLAAERTANRPVGVQKVLFMPYALLYMLLTRSTSHAHELAADEVAVRGAGKEATRSALGKMFALTHIFERAKSAYIREVPYHLRTHDLLSRFHEYLAGPQGAILLAELSQRRLTAETVPRFDPHPAPKTRLAALDTLPEQDTATADERTSWELLTAPYATLPQLERQLYEDL
ncbi:MAG: M48 family metallopeptidase [Kibdelosporangium sp.]